MTDFMEEQQKKRDRRPIKPRKPKDVPRSPKKVTMEPGGTGRRYMKRAERPTKKDVLVCSCYKNLMVQPIDNGDNPDGTPREASEFRCPCGETIWRHNLVTLKLTLKEREELRERSWPSKT